MLEKLPFHELDRFKEETKLSEVELYNATKERVRHYRLIFIGLGVVFLILAWAIDQKSALWFTAMVKPAIEFFAFALGIAAFTFAAFLRYETESVRALVHHSTGRLRQSFKLKKTSLSQDSEIPAAEIIRKRLSLWGHFTHAKEKLKKLELETLDLMNRISQSKELSLEEKERLYNLALLELKERFIPILKEYESS